MPKNKTKQTLKLTNKTFVFIDYGNVYGWNSSLKKPIDTKKIFNYLKSYPQIKSINFYYGIDSHPKSLKFLNKIKKIGFNLITKPVKYITLGKINGNVIKKRKCDFDIEICMDVLLNLNRFDSYIFFSGDGDFAPLYQYLINQQKQVIVVYTKNHIGKEIWEIKKGLFKIQFVQLGL